MLVCEHKRGTEEWLNWIKMSLMTNNDILAYCEKFRPSKSERDALWEMQNDLVRELCDYCEELNPQLNPNWFKKANEEESLE